MAKDEIDEEVAGGDRDQEGENKEARTTAPTVSE